MQRSRPIIEPIHTATIGDQPIRFFRGPGAGPDMPWHAVEDLYKALGLPRDLRRELLRRTQGSWPGVLRTVATSTGLATIAPHYVAQGVIGAAIETGSVSTGVEGEYAMAGTKALKVLVGDLPLEATLAFVAQAFRNETAGGPE